MKKIGLAILILIFLVMGVLAAKDAIIKTSIRGIISTMTGLEVNIGSLKTSLPKTLISIQNVVIFNPKYFDDRIMLDVPLVYIDYSLPALFRKKVHLNDVRINLKELTIIKAKDGKTNLDSIKGLQQKDGPKKKQGPKASNFEIDNLWLKLGTITYKDYSAGEKPVISKYNINLDARYRNVTDTSQIMRIIIAKALINTAIGKLSAFSKFEDVGSDVLKDGRDTLKKSIEKTVDELKSIFESPF